MNLEQRLASLRISRVPTWVFDADHFCHRWANAPALELWRSDSVDELLSRDYSDMTASTRARMRSYIEGFREGRGAEEDWTLYPRGVPSNFHLYFSGIELDDGRLAALIQAFPTDQPFAPAQLRTIEALRHTSVLVSLLDAEGALLLQNPAAIQAFGELTPFARRFSTPNIVTSLLETAAQGHVYQTEAALQTSTGERWYTIEARRIPDPVTGAMAVLVHMSDETARRGAERVAEEKSRLAEELERALALVERQKHQILSLSAPILDLAEGIIAVPIIGYFDQERSAELTQRLLPAISERRAFCAILDWTGANFDDLQSVENITLLAGAIRLLGARPIITGISAEMARTLTANGTSLKGVLLLRSLRDGLAAVASMSQRPSRSSSRGALQQIHRSDNEPRARSATTRPAPRTG